MTDIHYYKANIKKGIGFRIDARPDGLKKGYCVLGLIPDVNRYANEEEYRRDNLQEDDE